VIPESAVTDWPPAWRFTAQLLSNALIAILVWFLARGRIKSERWHERQAEVYLRIVEDLYVIQEYYGGHLANATSDETGQPAPHPRSYYEQMRPGVDAAVREIERHAAVGPFLLTPEAVAILKDFTRQRNDPANHDVTAVEALSYLLARDCWVLFSERAQRDLGRLGWVRYHWRRWRRPGPFPGSYPEP
jgi:hypothetical protein